MNEWHTPFTVMLVAALAVTPFAAATIYQRHLNSWRDHQRVMEQVRQEQLRIDRREGLPERSRKRYHDRIMPDKRFGQNVVVLNDKVSRKSLVVRIK